MEIYEKIRKNGKHAKKSRQELQNYIIEGLRPVYGFPHMNFGSSRVDSEEKDQNDPNKNWRIM